MKQFALVVAITTLYSPLIMADCNYPKAPVAMPSAASASEADMVAAMSEYKHYNADVDAYLACLDSELDKQSKDSTAASSLLQFKAMHQKKKSAAAEERNAKIGQFNEQVRQFKARTS